LTCDLDLDKIPERDIVATERLEFLGAIAKVKLVSLVFSEHASRVQLSYQQGCELVRIAPVVQKLDLSNQLNLNAEVIQWLASNINHHFAGYFLVADEERQQLSLFLVRGPSHAWLLFFIVEAHHHVTR
jgi:hypothetical protein